MLVRRNIFAVFYKGINDEIYLAWRKAGETYVYNVIAMLVGG